MLSLFDRWIGKRSNVYRFSIGVTLVFAVLAGLETAGVVIPSVQAFLAAHVPLYAMGMGWLLPALLAALLGYFVPAGAASRAGLSLRER